MKIRIPDFVALYHTGEKKIPSVKPTFEGERVEFDNRNLSETLECSEGRIELTLEGDELKVRATTYGVGIRYIQLRFNEKTRKDVKILGDAYERGYGDLSWQTIRPERCMPWYMAASNGSDIVKSYTGRLTECFGVEVCPNAICFWQYDTEGVTLWLDLRCGGSGTELGGRMLDCATVIFKEYRDVSAHSALEQFASEMCKTPYLPTHKVYGSNNWYYAYGKSSHGEILEDTKLLADMCRGLENRPYMVIDDGWQPNSTDAPWDTGNERFPDMKGLCESMKELDVRPGIWVRYLINGHNGKRKITVPEEWYLSRSKNVFDPSREDVLDYVAKITDRLTREWGYELIKHDFSTFDIFGKWGMAMVDKICDNGWSFYDRTKTSAEIIKNFYRVIRDNANGAVIIGCNCIGHLCATYHQLQRTGDDTSGYAWSKTARMGVNTLAFRNHQNGRFFMADADCVGITGAIDWELNK